MAQYVALLRGIAPMNPNMRNERLRTVFEDLGFDRVRTVIATGNVLFETRRRNTGALESDIEKAITKRLGFSSATILRSESQIAELINRDPFNGWQDTPTSRLNVTFLKNAPRVKLKYPHRIVAGAFELIGIHDGAICSVVDPTNARTPDMMSWLDKQFGKQITTRTWKTVHRIADKFGK